MLFENRTKETIKVRVVEKTRNNLHGWRNVKPEGKIDLEKGYGLRMKLTLVDEDESPKDKTSNDPENPEDPIDDWKEEILSVKNVGPARTRDILESYPTRTSLIEAVKAKNHLVMEDDVAEHFTEKYGDDDENDTG